MLEKAMILAAKGHMGQVDKGGHPYILHPTRVMLSCKTVEEKTVAMMHDLLEDTAYTEDDLREEGFPEKIIEAVVCLTKTEGEEYADYVERICQNKLAARVKLADLKDNMDLNRLPGLTPKDFQRLEKYLRTKIRIEQALEE
ncbi:MAG: GTP pyrophosphokinase [Anaerotignum sp.]|nr:GTP pyrophosphokinase [Anaerotignum sp.]